MTPEQRAEQEAAWNNMMEAHDRVMPRMGDLYAATKQLIPIMEGAKEQNPDLYTQAHEAILALEEAEDGMMDWMNGVKEQPLDSLRAKYDHAGIMANIDRQQVTIEEVEKDFDTSLDNAKSFLEEQTSGGQ